MDPDKQIALCVTTGRDSFSDTCLETHKSLDNVKIIIIFKGFLYLNIKYTTATLYV